MSPSVDPGGPSVDPGGPSVDPVGIVLDHNGKVALVTGAGAGIGREVARWLARAGAAVAVNDVRADKAEAVVTEITAAGGVAHPFIADCRDDDAVDSMVEAVVSQFGGLDIAVNNIGMLPRGRSPRAFTNYRGEDWRDIVDQNLVLAALCGRAEAAAMIASGSGGVILFVTSGETTRPSPYNSIYAAAKAALNHLVTSMAVELGPSGIRVLAIAPGTTLTETVAAAFTEERMEQIVASTPLRRMVEHDELARLTTFLASDLARCITGQFILADAGAFLSRNRPANDEGLEKDRTSELTRISGSGLGVVADSDATVGHGSDVLNSRGDQVAVAQQLSLRHSHTRGSAGKDEVASRQSGDVRDVRHQSRNVEDQLRGRTVLAHLVVDFGGKTKVRGVGDKVERDHPWPDRPKGIEGLAEIEVGW